MKIFYPGSESPGVIIQLTVDDRRFFYLKRINRFSLFLNKLCAGARGRQQHAHRNQIQCNSNRQVIYLDAVINILPCFYGGNILVLRNFSAGDHQTDRGNRVSCTGSLRNGPSLPRSKMDKKKQGSILSTDISRRDFVNGTLIGVGATLLTAAAPGCTAKPKPAAVMNDSWTGLDRLWWRWRLC
jgi:hypothetical protein